MGKHRFKGKSKANERGASPIKSGSPSDVPDGLFSFSLKFYDTTNPKFRCDGRGGDYFRTLLDRLKELSREKVSALTNRKGDTGTQFHRIDFGDERVSEDGFGIPRSEQYDDEAWQFSLSANKNGRVHGFLIENVFYVVWLDPDHGLYPGT